MASGQDLVAKLKKELKLTKEKCDDLALELQEKENQLLKIEDERNKYVNEVFNARNQMNQVDKIIQEKVDVEIQKERITLREKLKQIDDLKAELKTKEHIIELKNEELDRKQAEVDAMNQRLRELKIGGYEMNDALKDIKNYREEKLQAARKIQELTSKINDLEGKLDDVVAENRHLRDLAEVGDNYGVIEDIKFTSKQKNEDYKRLLAASEKARAEREKEVADLRHQLIQMTVLYNDVGENERYRGLTMEQLHIVDRFVLKLKEGKQEFPLTDKSKELEAEVQKLQAKLEFVENNQMNNLENAIAKLQGVASLQKSTVKNVSAGDDKNKTQTMNPGVSEELYQKLITMVENLASRPQDNQRDFQQTQDAGGAHVIQWPPVPLSGPFGNWSDVREGFSYRFKTKLPVDMGDFYADQGFDQVSARYEIAALQLHNIETIELLERKEREISSLTIEIEEIKNEMKNMLLIQDELFKQYVTEKATFKAKMTAIERRNEELSIRTQEAEHKAQLTEALVQNLRKTDEKDLRASLSEYAKKVSIQEVNLIRLSRKYDALQSDEKNLRQAYEKVEVAYAEKEHEMNERLAELTAWKTKATHQLKLLFDLQVNSVSKDDYHTLRNQLELMQEKYADIKNKESQYLSRISALQSMERQVISQEELIKEIKEDLMENELEMEMMSRRLEELDPIFKKYNVVMRRLVEVITNGKKSPLYFFEKMDDDHNGKVDRKEFELALISMQVQISKQEFETFFSFLDQDGSGLIEYKEFIKKLKRSGAKFRTSEDDIVYMIYEGITKLNLSLQSAFDLFDIDKDKLISKSDMVNTFAKMDYKMDLKKVEEFFLLADMNRDGQINFEEFYRLFESVIKEAFKEENKMKMEKLDWKMEIMLKIEKAIKESGTTIFEAFKLIDSDQTGKIKFEEFQKFFKSAGRDIQESELRNLFYDIDKDRSGEISFPEFQYYLNSVKKEKERIDRIKLYVNRAENLRDSSMAQIEKMENDIKTLELTEVQKLKMRVALLETREKNGNHKIDILQMKNKNLEDEIKKQDRQLCNLEEQVLKYQELYYQALNSQNLLEKRLEGTLPREKAQNIYKFNQKLTIERQELKRNMITFKSLYESCVSQIKILKLSVDKEKNEIEVYQNTIRELQAQSDENTLIGKLQHELMISKWNEGVANKKYESALDQARQYKLQIESYDDKYQEKEDEIISVHNTYREKCTTLEKTLTETKLKIIPTLTLAKIEELTNKIKEIHNQKAELEKQNRKLVDEVATIKVDLDYLETQKQATEDLAVTLRKTYVDDLSQELIKLSQKLSEYKLSELKAKRDQIQLTQREEYYQKLIKEYTDQMKELEETVSQWEVKFTQREDFWRKRHSEQMKLIFEKEGFVAEKEKAKADPSKNFETKKTHEQLKDLNVKQEEIAHGKNRINDLEHAIKEKNARIEILEQNLAAIEKGRRALPDFNANATGQSIREALHDEEAKKFAQEAQKIIQALQEIIDDKNKQLEKKDEDAKAKREQYMIHKAEDAKEIKRLHEELEKAQRANNSKFQNFANNSQPLIESTVLANEAILIEKDKKLEFLNRQLENIKDQNKNYQSLIQRAELEIRSLRDQLALEKDRAESNNLQKEIQSLHAKLKAKDQDLQAQKKFIEETKDAYMRISSVSSVNVEDIKNQLVEKEKSTEMKMKAATKQIEELREKNSEMAKELKEINKNFNQNNASMTLLKEENAKLKIDIKKQEDNVNNEKKNVRDLTRQIETLRADLAKKDTSTISDTKAKELNEKIAALEKQNQALQVDRPTDFFDDKNYLKGDGRIGFSSSDAICKKVGKWVKRQTINILNDFQDADKDKSGWIAPAKVLSIFENAGVRLQERDQETLFKDFKKNRHAEIEYIDLYYRMKGIRDMAIQQVEDSQPEAPTTSHVTKETKTNMSDKEKTLSRGIDILKLEVANLKKENDKLEKQLNNWKENYSKLDKEYKSLLGKPISKIQEETDPNKKTTSIHKLETIQELRDKIFELENKCAVLEKKINAECEPLIKKLKQDKDKLDNEIKSLKSENLKITAQMDNIKSKKMTPEAMKEEVIYEKDMIISNLKEKLDILRNKENALENKVFELEQKNFELVLDKEGHDIQIQRLNRRIQELDDFKNSYNELKNTTMTSTMKKK